MTHRTKSQGRSAGDPVIAGHPRRFARRTTVALAAASTLLWGSSLAPAANYYWDPLLANVDPGSGGTGTWDTTSAFWKLANTPGDVVWSNALTNTSTFSGTAGTVTVGTALNTQGLVFATAGYTLAGGTTNNLFVGASGIDSTALATGTTTINQGLNVAANQSWNLGAANTLNLGTGITGGVGQLTISSGTINYTGTVFAPAKFTLAGGSTFNSSGTAAAPVGGTHTGIGDNGNATLNVTAGTFATAAALFLGAGPTTTPLGGNFMGSANVSGGTLTTTSTVNLGDGFNNNSNAIGVLTISAGQVTTGAATGDIRLGNLGSGSGTINLNGGTLSTNAAIAPGTFASATAGLTRASVSNFDGGTLQALGTGLMMANTVTANVRDAGARVDTNAFNVTLAANSIHSTTGGGAVTDGGLTKLGAATLALRGASTGTGPVVFNGGGIASSGATPRTFSNVVSQTGAGSFTFGATATYTGALAFTDTAAIPGGTRLGNGSALGTMTINVNGQNADTAQLQLAGGITVDNIFQSDAGTLTLSGNLAGTAAGATFNRPYYFAGAGNGIVNGNIAVKASGNTTVYGSLVV